MKRDSHKERIAVVFINKAIKTCVHPIQLSGVLGMVSGFAMLYPGSRYFDAIMLKIQFRNWEIKRIAVTEPKDFLIQA